MMNIKLIKKYFSLYIIVYFTLTLTLIFVTISSVDVNAATFTDNSAATFNGTNSNTQFDNTNLGLTTVNNSTLTSTYTSNVKNAGGVSPWSNFKFVPKKPYYLEMPANGGSNSGYLDGNISMANNIAYWRANENNGSTSFADSSGNSNSATCGSICPANSTGNGIKGAFQFNNQNAQFAVTKATNSVRNSSIVSLNFWVRLGSAVGTATSKTVYEEIRVGSTTVVRFGVKIVNDRFTLYGTDSDAAASSVVLVTHPTTVVVGEWYHVVGVYNATSDIHKLYVNSSLQSATVARNAFPNTVATTFPRIGQGANVTSANKLANAFLDEIALFTGREITQTEVNHLYGRGQYRIAFKAKTCATLVACSSANFLGPAGTTSSNDNFWENTNTGLIPGTVTTTLNPTFFPNNQYFQYQMIITQSSTLAGSAEQPLIKSVNVDYTPFSAPTPTLAFTIRNSLDTATNSSCSLGALKATQLAECAYRLKISSTNLVGYNVYILTNGSFSNGSDIIADAVVGSGGSGGSVIDSSKVGTENYGIKVEKGSITGTGSTTLGTSFNAGSTNYVRLNNTTQQLLVNSSGNNQPLSSGDLTNTIKVTHRANISSSTPAGYYVQSVKYIVIPTF